MTMDRDSLSMNNLASSLPATNNATSNELNVKFKEAALSITTLYRASLAAQQRAHSAGYSAALQDVLSYVQTGLSDGSMDIGAVLDWLEARAATVQSDDDDDEHHHTGAKIVSVPASSTAQLVKRITQAKENAHHHQRKTAAKLASKSPSPPPRRPPSPLQGTKRRHAALYDAHPSAGDNNLKAGERLKRGKPKSARVPNPLPVPAAPAFVDIMDVEDERERDPRERKRVARR